MKSQLMTFLIAATVIGSIGTISMTSVFIYKQGQYSNLDSSFNQLDENFLTLQETFEELQSNYTNLENDYTILYENNTELQEDYDEELADNVLALLAHKIDKPDLADYFRERSRPIL